MSPFFVSGGASVRGQGVTPWATPKRGDTRLYEPPLNGGEGEGVPGVGNESLVTDGDPRLPPGAIARGA